MNRMIMLTLLLTVAFMACKDDGSVPPCPPEQLDTTSHSFAWQTFLFGDGGGSILRDVAIVNDTLAYAVGEIMKRDSVGNWEAPYSIAIWNGREWRLKRLVGRYPNQNSFPIQPSGVLALSASDVWFAWYDVFHWDGTSDSVMLHWLRAQPGNPSPVIAADQGISRLWGTSTQTFYGCGVNGGLTVYIGGIWRAIGSGTNLPFRDIFGATDPCSGQQTILAVASGFSPAEGKKLLSIRGTTVSALPDQGLSWSLNALWFAPGCKYYVVGAGIHYKSSLLEIPWNSYPSGVVTSYASSGIRGNNANDVFVVGSFFEVVHYNGSTWYNYRNEIPFGDGVFGEVAIKNDLVIAVGQQGQQAAVLVGRR